MVGVQRLSVTLWPEASDEPWREPRLILADASFRGLVMSGTARWRG
jgi:hypothetical protein